jgi:hypothetical protein
MWVRGLCDKCNHMSGVKVDRAYAAFAHALRRCLQPSSRRLLLVPSDVPAVPIAPGLVARSVFIGMQAIDPRLRTSFPQLAMDLVSGREQIGLPVGLRLRAAMYLSREARLAGPIHSYRVLTRSEAYPSQAEIYFPLTRVDLRMLTRTFPLVRHPLSRAPDEWVSLTNDDIAPILVGDVQPR